MVLSTRKAVNELKLTVANHDTSTTLNSASSQEVGVITNSYVLNKVQALKKKLQQCDLEHLSYEMKPNRNFVMKFSPAAYELAKLVVVEHLYSEAIAKQYFIESSINEDECKYQVGSLFRVYNRKRNGTKGNYHKFTINFYHTTSSVLVNGNKVDNFERELFDPICRQIQGACKKLNIMNVKISEAISTSLEDHINVVSHKNIKEIDNNPQIDNSIIYSQDNDSHSGSETSQKVIELSPPVNGKVSEPVDSSQKVNYMYNCPACDQVADSDTIECEECNEWFHFDCTGGEQSKVNDIPEDVPFICIFCNDRTLNLDNDIQLEENQPEDDHQVSDTVSLPPVIDNHENTDSSSEPPVPTQKDTNLHKITVSEKRDKVAAETESNENSKKNNKTRKQNASNKKSNSESNETLLAQKYYISSLENKVSHLENLVNVLQKTLDTN